MSTAPVVSWYEADNETVLSQWDIGIVDAGTVSTEKTILIWNNRGGTEDVSDMQECKITTTDNQGDVMDLVKDKWVECRVDSIEGDDFTAIGGKEAKEIRAEGQAEGIIKGTANAALLEDAANYAKVTLRARPPLNSPAGQRNFKVRVSYYYT